MQKQTAHKWCMSQEKIMLIDRKNLSEQVNFNQTKSFFFEYSTKGNETYHFPYTKTQKNPELSNLVSPLSNFRPDYYICARELSIDRRWAIFCLMFWIMEKRYLVHIPFFGFGTSFFLCHINRSKPLPIFNRALKNKIQYS